MISDYDDLARDLLGIFEEEALYNLNDEDLNEDQEDFDDYKVALDDLDVEDEEESDKEVDEIALNDLKVEDRANADIADHFLEEDLNCCRFYHWNQVRIAEIGGDLVDFAH